MCTLNIQTLYNTVLHKSFCNHILYLFQSVYNFCTFCTLLPPPHFPPLSLLPFFKLFMLPKDILISPVRLRVFAILCFGKKPIAIDEADISKEDPEIGDQEHNNYEFIGE